MSTVIKNIRIITGNGDVIEHGSLKYEDDAIVAITQEMLTGDIVIDGTGKTMIPGLFDCHVHLGMEVPENGRTTNAANDTELGVRIMRQCLEFPRYGVTCVRNMGTESDGDMTVRDVFQREDYPAVRILASGGAISITGGHGNLADGFDDVTEVLTETRRKIRRNVDVIKFVVTGGMATKSSKPGSVQYSVEDLKPSVEEAKICGKITGAHCTSLPGARNAILAGIRSIEHAQLDEETVELMVKRQNQGDEIFYCPTLIARYSILHNDNPEFAWLKAKAKPEDMERKIKAVRLCHDYGIPVCASTDTNAPFVHVGDVLDEIALYTRCGLDEMEAIQTATRNAAKLCMLDQITGTLEVGKRADFVILSDNPLSDIENLKLVEMTCRDGRILYQKHV